MVLKNIFDVISFKQFMTPTIIEVDAIGGEESEIYHEQKFQNFLDILWRTTVILFFAVMIAYGIVSLSF